MSARNVFALAVLSLTSSAFAYVLPPQPINPYPPPPPRVYQAGSGTSVSSWSAKDAPDAQKAGKPICVYVYDPKQRDNEYAKALETLFADKGIQDALQGCTVLKIKQDGSDAKGWPQDWYNMTKNGALFAFMNSDGKNLKIFNKDTNQSLMNAAAITEFIKNLIKAEESMKAANKPPGDAPKPSEAK